jgi:putative endonuclease
MYFIYILKDKQTSELYYGYTSNLERRLEEHGTNGKWKLVYYEAYASENDARAREGKLKHYGQSRNHLKDRIKKSLQL